MRFVIPLTFLLLAPLCLAQSDPPSMDEYMEKLTPELRTRIDKARPDFDHWPDDRGKAAAEEILDVGPAAIPFLARDLEEGSAKAKACAAHVAGRMAADGIDTRILFPYLVTASKNKQCRPYLREFLRSMVRIDPGASEDPLIDWLYERDTIARSMAEKFLDTMIDKELIGKLGAVLTSNRDGAREAALRLLSRIDEPAAHDLMLAHLSDKSANVAKTASDGLARSRHPQLIAKIVKAFGNIKERPAAFALRTMIIMEDNHGIQVLDPKWSTRLLDWTKMADFRFIRAIGTVGLINMGTTTDDTKVIEFLDRWSVPVLIDTIGGGVFFSEYRAVHDLCKRKLMQVTGVRDELNVADWKTWWDGNRATFKAVRGLKEVDGIQVEKMEIRYSTSEPGKKAKTYYFSVDSRWGTKGPQTGVEPIVLSETEMEGALTQLKKVRFFEMQRQSGTETERGRKVDLTVVVGNLVRQVLLFGYGQQFFEPILEILDDLVEKHRWQRYWDKRSYPAWQRWYDEHASFWLHTGDPLARNAKLKTMIVMSFEFLEENEREIASKELLALIEQDSMLSDSGITILSAYLDKERTLSTTAENLVKVLAETRQMSAIRNAVKFLLKGKGEQTTGLLTHVFKKGGFLVCRLMLREEEPRVRAAACEVMWQFENEEVDGLLQDSIHDTSLGVKRSAVFGLGKRGNPVAIPSLEKIVADQEDLEMTKTALIALGRIGEESSMATLIGALADEKLRPAAIRGLGASRRPDGVSPIFAILERSGDNFVLRQLCIDALTEIGGTEVLERFSKMARLGESPALRQAAIHALGSVEFEGREAILENSLEDPDPRVAVEAALQLSSLGNSTAVPLLIQAMAQGTRSLMSERALQRLTFHKGEGKNGAEKARSYEKWWSENSGLSPRVWLLTALRTRGYPVDTLVDYASGKSQDRKGCPLLIAALRDDDWYIAAGVSRALVEISGHGEFPMIDEDSTSEERSMTQMVWTAWWKERRKIDGGGD